MGHNRHDILVLTSCYYDMPVLRRKALRIFKDSPEVVSEILPSPMNGYKTFVIAPSGSKVGWAEQVKHDEAIKRLIAYVEGLRYLRYEDNSCPIQFAEIVYYDDMFSLSHPDTHKTLGIRRHTYDVPIIG